MPPLKNKELILRMSPYCESSARLASSVNFERYEPKRRAAATNLRRRGRKDDFR